MPAERGWQKISLGVWTSHRPGTDSRARRYDTGSQPAGMAEDDSARPARPESPASDPAGLGRDAASESLTGQAAAAPTVAVIAAAAIATEPRLRPLVRLRRPRPAIATSAVIRPGGRGRPTARAAVQSFGRTGS